MNGSCGSSIFVWSVVCNRDDSEPTAEFTLSYNEGPWAREEGQWFLWACYVFSTNISPLRGEMLIKYDTDYIS